MRYLLDSVILIDHFNGADAASQFIIEHGAECAISAITRAEVLTGFDAKSAKKAKVLLETFSTIAITKVEADRAAILRQEHRWKLPDALQASVALDASPYRRFHY